MRRGLTIATVALAAVCLAAPAGAVQSTADLREACASDDLATRNLCYGYILGAGQLYIELRRAEVIGEIACADPVPTLEVIRVYRRRVDRHSPGARFRECHRWPDARRRRELAL